MSPLGRVMKSWQQMFGPLRFLWLNHTTLRSI
ncbi:hypothetical protein CFP56_034987 [Quercus suber]|uniref:Uncharacterized protein n=1 Tax=Quercus suber TaxID=58331 RepID=A0AAW0JAS7_QUESU